MLGAGAGEKPGSVGDGNLVCRKQVGHALSVPDREGRHLLPEDLGPGEPVVRTSVQKKIKKIGTDCLQAWHYFKIFAAEIFQVSDKII